MDTDGTTNDGKAYYCTVSPGLAEDVRQLVESLGGVATITDKDAFYKKGGERVLCQKAYILYIKLPDNADAFFLPRKKLAAGKPQGLYRRLASIEPDGEEEAVCITVDHPDGLYLTRDFIVTHNSYWLRWLAFDLVLYWYAKFGIKNARFGIFCEDYPTLKDRQISKVKIEFPPELGKWVGSDNEWRFHDDFGGGVIAFRNLDDPSKYMSAEFAGVGVDELTKNPESVFSVLRGSLRWPGIEHTVFVGATNPGERGHLWVKRLWIDRNFPPELKSMAKDFAFVRALPTDNPHNAASYIEELKTLPPKLARAWLEGDWSVFEGQVFEEWRDKLHILEDFRPPPNWEWGAGLDFGHRAKGVMPICACGSENRVVVMDEFVFQGMDADKAGEEAGRKLKKYPPIPYICADEEMFWDTGMGETKAELFQKGLNRAMKDHAPVLIKTTHGRGSRLGSLELFHRYLRWEEVDGMVPEWLQPRLRFHKRCKYLIETIPALPYAKETATGVVKEDVDTTAEDHGYDGLRYFLMSRPTFGEPIPTLYEEDKHPGLTKEGKRKPPPWAVHDEGDGMEELPWM
jgi:hypothetical protein